MGNERTSILRRTLIFLMMIALIAVSAVIGLLIANWPACVRYFAAGH